LPFKRRDGEGELLCPAFGPIAPSGSVFRTKVLGNGSFRRRYTSRARHVPEPAHMDLAEPEWYGDQTQGARGAAA